MKKRKILLLIISLFCFSGCTIDYNIHFTKKHQLDETVIITESNDKLQSQYYSIDEIINSKLDSYNSEISRFKKTVQKNTDDVQVKLESKNILVTRFKKMMFFQKIFNDADIVENEDYYSFETNDYYDSTGLFNDLSGTTDGGYVDKININITFDEKVIENNADSVNEKTNTYTWILDKDTKDKKIMFKLKNEKPIIVKKEKNKTVDIIIKILISIVGIIILIAMLVGFKIISNNNKI